MDYEKIPRPFDFTRDRFAFANDLAWEYQFDAATGKMSFRPQDPKPAYTHRCFVLIRVARQFLYHARFDATRKAVNLKTAIDDEFSSARRFLRRRLASNF